MFRDTSAFSSFAVDDVPRAAQFYGETLGLEVSDENGMLTLALAGGGRVLIYPKPDHVPASHTVLNFAVDDVEKAVDGLIEKGITFERYEEMGHDFDAKGIFRGGGPLIAWFLDPAGNTLAVLQAP